MILEEHLMENKRTKLDKIINFINKKTALNFYCDFFDDDTLSGEVDLFNGENDIGITINNLDEELISIFVSFYYQDISESDFKKKEYYKEAALETRSFLLENSFHRFLKSNSNDILVYTWDDGCYGCPGGYDRVGYANIALTDRHVLKFVNVCKRFEKQFGSQDNNELRKYIIERICFINEIPIQFQNDNSLVLGRNAVIALEKRKSGKNNVQEKFLGVDSFLFKVEGTLYYAEALPIKIFEEIVEECECFSSISLYYFNEILYISSEHLSLKIKAYSCPDEMFSRIEQMTLETKLGSFLPFSSSTKKTFFEKFVEPSEEQDKPYITIITEGETDWKFIEKFWKQLKFNYPGLRLKFYKYETSKVNMGGQALLNMCKGRSIMSDGNTYIYIADRDDPRVLKEFCEDDKDYKYWGNLTYSMVLPVPEHRMNSKEICIEHYFSDDEIKTKYPCSDGIERRLYLGNEFDKYGRGIKENLLCTKRSVCGPQSIKIIDGTQDCRVISFNSSDEINYALPKSVFAQNFKCEKDSVSFKAFKNLFDVICSILKNDEK